MVTNITVNFFIIPTTHPRKKIMLESPLVIMSWGYMLHPARFTSLPSSKKQKRHIKYISCGPLSYAHNISMDFNVLPQGTINRENVNVEALHNLFRHDDNLRLP